MEAFLVVALIISNTIWVVYLDQRDKRDANERRELMNRIADPEIQIEDVQETNWKSEKIPDPFAPTQEMTLEERAEYSAIGRVDPDLERSDG